MYEGRIRPYGRHSGGSRSPGGAAKMDSRFHGNDGYGASQFPRKWRRRCRSLLQCGYFPVCRQWASVLPVRRSLRDAAKPVLCGTFYKRHPHPGPLPRGSGSSRADPEEPQRFGVGWCHAGTGSERDETAALPVPVTPGRSPASRSVALWSCPPRGAEPGRLQA